MPAASNPFDASSWAVAISFEEEGYVSDDDAEDMDFDDLLETMQDDTADASKQRIRKGFESIKLVGWADAPHYNAETHKLYWAKEIQFGDAEENTLNYNIRILGRKGYLVMNFIAGMPQLADIKNQLPEVLALSLIHI